MIYNQSWVDHLDHLRTVLQQLRQAGLTAEPKKCHLGMEQCTYLGYVVGKGQVKSEQSKIDAVTNFAQPVTIKDVRAFLGMTGCYRKFIPQYSTLVCHSLISQGNPALTELTGHPTARNPLDN